MAKSQPHPVHRMKATLILLVFALCQSCTVMTGNRNAGTFAYASVGGDATGLKLTPDGVEAASVDNSKSFSTGVKTVGTVVATGIVTDGLTAGQQILHDGITKRLVATEGTTRAIAAGKEATKQAGIAAEVTKATHVP